MLLHGATGYATQSHQRLKIRSFLHPVGPLASHLPEFPFLGELAAQGPQVIDEIAACLDEHLARGLLAIGLDTQLEFTAEMKVLVESIVRS
jgi:anthranilate phosphoribosyltransferase